MTPAPPAAERKSHAAAGADRRRVIAMLVLLAMALAMAAAGRMLVGEPIPRTDAGAIDWNRFGTILLLRQDRLLIGLIVGAALAVAGVLLQALLRNPLASPYLLGVSSGAALGQIIVATLVYYEAITFGAVWFDHAGALFGAVGAMAVVYLLAQKRGWIDPVGLLLVGVIVNAICAAGIMFVNALVPNGLRGQIGLWIMGFFNDGADGWTIRLVGIAVAGGVALAWWMGRAMDVATFSDEEAHGLGLHLPRLRLALFALAAAMTALTMALAGPVGFVGLVCPHLVRLMVGPAHRPVVIGSALAGGALLIAADTTIKVLQTTGVVPSLLPVGVLTAIIGGPIFLFMLRPRLGGLRA